MPEAKPSLPGWMAEVKMDSPVLESASIRSGRSGAASRPADMGDLDRMLQSVEKMGFQGISFGAVGGLGGLRAVGDSDEDEVEFETGRGMGAGVPGQQPPQRGQSVTAQSGADRIGRNPSVGPGGSRAPRSASAGAPSMPSYGGIGQKSPGLGIEPVPPTGGGVRTPPGGGGYTPQPAGGPQSMQRGAPQPGFSPNLSSQQMRGATPVGFNVNPIPGNQGGFVPPTRTGSVGGPVPMNQQLSSSGFPAGRSPSLGRQPRPLPAQPGQQQQQQQYQK
ncbi:hypothetical protein BC830DRAFT_152199 [Chytriomyces sp. MP71]|nr:hypothetical protein BC830DRAFT_152199 [Chytriomyces sp. MP71]